MKNLYRSFYALILAVGVCTVSPAYSEEYQCEIMTVSGNATSDGRALKEGDLLKKGDTIKVDAGSYVDVAFDKEWNNITRLNEKSEVTIKEVYPTGLKMVEGGIFAKLHKLPKGTTFEIQTPTAVAAVRGSEYFTEHREGVTQVFNYSPSPVEVFSFDKTGGLMDRTVVQEAEKTEVRAVAEPPLPPAKMSADEMKRTTEISGGMESNIKEVKFEGRAGQAPDVKVVEADLAARMPYLAPAAGTTADGRPATATGTNQNPNTATAAAGATGDPNAPKPSDDQRPMNGPNSGGPGSGTGGGPAGGNFNGPGGTQFTATTPNAPVMPNMPMAPNVPNMPNIPNTAAMVDRFNDFGSTAGAPVINNIIRATDSGTMGTPPQTVVTGGTAPTTFDPNNPPAGTFPPPPPGTHYCGQSASGQPLFCPN